MAWSLAAVLVLAVALLVLAQIRRRRRAATSQAGSRKSPGARQQSVPARASRAQEPEQAPVKSCPVCLCEYPTQNRFCVRDGAELAEGHASGPFSQGMICPTCRRGYPLDASFCPEDADELVPYGLYGAASSTRPPVRIDINKICPECGVRHAAAHSFCGHDGTELVVVN